MYVKSNHCYMTQVVIPNQWWRVTHTPTSKWVLRSSVVLCWSYNVTKFLLCSSRDLAWPVFPNSLTGLLWHNKFFNLFKKLSNHFPWPVFQKFHQYRVYYFKTNFASWWEYYLLFNTSWIIYEIEVLFIYLLIIWVSESWIFSSSVCFSP